MMGWQEYTYFRAENTWGTKDGAGTDIYIHHTVNDISVKNQSYEAALFTGLRQKKHRRNTKATIDGSIQSPLWAHQYNSKSVAQYFIEAAVSGPSSPTLSSFTGMVYDNGNDDKRHLGLRVNSLVIAGSGDGDGTLTMNAGFMGKEEQNEASIPSIGNPIFPREFTYDEVEFYLGDYSQGESASSSSDIIRPRNFELSITNNLQAYHTNSFFPSHLVAGGRAVGLKFGVFKEDDTYDAAKRTNTPLIKSAHIVLKGNHGGTGTNTKTRIDIYIDHLEFVTATDTREYGGLTTVNTEWVALKPTSSENEIEFEFDTE